MLPTNTLEKTFKYFTKSSILSEIMKNRDRSTIVADILNIANKGEKKTRIMYKANLSYEQLVEYLKLLVEMGLLEEKILENERNPKVYVTTKKGRNFLDAFEKIENQLNSAAQSIV